MIRPQQNKIVILFSGGIDSTVLLYKYLTEGYDVYPLYINYGQITYEGESTAIRNILSDINISSRLFTLDVKSIKKIGVGSLIEEYPKSKMSKKEWFKSEFFPNRNLILLSLAADYCYKIGGRYVAIGLVGIDSYADTSSEFITGINNIFKITIPTISVIAPYVGMERKILIDDGIKLKVPFKKTFSCNSLGKHHCLICNSCLDREYAFKYIYGYSCI